MKTHTRQDIEGFTTSYVAEFGEPGQIRKYVSSGAVPAAHSVFSGRIVTGSGTTTTPCADTTSPREVKFEEGLGQVAPTAEFNKITITHCALGKVSKPKKATGALVVKSSKPSTGTFLSAATKVDLKLAAKPKKKGS